MTKTEEIRGSVLNQRVIRHYKPGDVIEKNANVAVFTNPNHECFLVEKEIPVPKAGEVVIHVRACGLCGTDIHFLKEGKMGERHVEYEYGLGHEASGDVVAIGEGVTNVKPGDRVAIEPGIPCKESECAACSYGKYNLCPKVVFYSTPPYDGCMTRFHCQPADWVFKIPDNMSYAEAAIMEPLYVAVCALDTVNIKVGDPVVVTGSGTIGLLVAAVAKAAGAGEVYIVDHIQDRLNMAAKLVPFTKQIKVEPDFDSREFGLKFRKDTNDLSIRAVFECSGMEKMLQAGCYLCGMGGVVHVIGCGQAMMAIPTGYMQSREIRLEMQYRYHHCWEKTIRIVSSGQVDIKSFASHFVPFERGPEAFDIALDYSKNATKVLVVEE